MAGETLVHVLRDNYTEAKIRGKKSLLLERQQLYSLAEFRTEAEILGFLADGPYGSELSKLEEGSSPAESERAIWQGFARSVRNLMKTAKGNIKSFLDEYGRRFDAYDLATLVIYKSQGRPWEEFILTRQPLATMKEKELRKLYSTEELEQIAEMVGDRALETRLEGLGLDEMTPDRASLARDIFKGWGEERFYSFIAKELHGRDRASCLPIVGSSIDLTNISIVLRTKLIGIQEARKHLVPVHWKLSNKSIDLLVGSEDLIQALDTASSLKYYRRVLAGARQRYDESKSLSYIEMATRKHMMNLSRQILLGFPYTIGVILAFLVLKENEARSLAAVVSGVAAGLKPDQIRPLVAA